MDRHVEEAIATVTTRNGSHRYPDESMIAIGRCISSAGTSSVQKHSKLRRPDGPEYRPLLKAQRVNLDHFTYERGEERHEPLNGTHGWRYGSLHVQSQTIDGALHGRDEA